MRFRSQRWQQMMQCSSCLASLVRQGAVDKSAAVDQLREIATAHGLVRAHGEDRVQALLAEAFADATFHSMLAEVA